MRKVAIVAVAGGMLLAGCTMTTRERYVAGGAAIGAGTGALIGAASTGTPQGAWAGAAIGGVAGGVIGAIVAPDGKCYVKTRRGYMKRVACR